MQTQKVGKVEAGSNTLAEARERVNKLMEKRNGEEFNFDERLEQAVQEVRKEEQKALEENTKRQQDILSYIELCNIRNSIRVINNNLSITS